MVSTSRANSELNLIKTRSGKLFRSETSEISKMTSSWKLEGVLSTASTSAIMGEESTSSFNPHSENFGTCRYLPRAVLSAVHQRADGPHRIVLIETQVCTNKIYQQVRC